LLRAYAHEVIEVSWPQQRRGFKPIGEIARLTVFDNRLLTFTPKDKREEILLAETMREFSTLAENRRFRLNGLDSAIPATLWGDILMGGAHNIVLSWLFDMEKHTRDR
jgi:hypothetical protein